MPNAPYSIRLADGSERSFETAAEMARWIDERRRFNALPASKRTPNQNRNRSSGRSQQKVRKVRCYAGDSPLARYANRNSNET